MSKKLLLVVAAAALVFSGTAFAGVDEDLMILMNDLNSELALAGADVRVEMVEYLTENDQLGRTVFFSNVGNKRLALDFVPGDPRRVDWSGPVGPGDDITWSSDTAEGAAPGVGLAATQQAISNAMATWDGVDCSDLPLTEVAGDNTGVLQFIFFGQGSPDPSADVMNAGFGTLVDLLLPPPIIAATFTFQFVDGGNPTDIDNDGRADAAFREIYYTNNFAWGIGTNIDVETVVLHEVGHGLSQGHFGKLSQTDANGKFHFSPRAVMNAGYTGVQRSPLGSDNAGHCTNWGSWPNR